MKEYIRKSDEKIAAKLYPDLYGKVLKVGNGIGYLTTFLTKDFDITVLDVAVSEGAVNKEKIQIYDGEHMPFPDQSFDCAVCVFVLHHTPNPEAVLKEMKRVAKRVIVVEEVYSNLLTKLELVYRDIYVNMLAGQPANIFWNSYFSESALRNLFQNTGLTISHTSKEPHRRYSVQTYVLESDYGYNEGMYASKDVAKDWITWVESIQGDVRDKEIYPSISARIAQLKPERILEIGSGQGVCSEKIDLQGAAYIGVEPSYYLRNRAHELYPSREFIAGRAEALPIKSGSMDFVYSIFVWFHIIDLNTAAEELARVLAPRAGFVIAVANPAMYDLWISWHKGAVVKGKELRGDMERLRDEVMYLHSLQEYTDSLQQSGLIIDNTQECGYDDKARGRGYSIMIFGHKP